MKIKKINQEFSVCQVEDYSLVNTDLSNDTPPIKQTSPVSATNPGTTATWEKTPQNP